MTEEYAAIKIALTTEEKKNEEANIEINRTKTDLQQKLTRVTEEYASIKIALTTEEKKNEEATHNNTKYNKTIELLNAAIETKQQQLDQNQKKNKELIKSWDLIML